MIFAWQGFQFEHPDDWAPALISGNRDEGYVRIASPDVLSFQVRWKRVRTSPELKRNLDGYLSRLRRDATKLKVKFQSHVHAEGEAMAYRWTGSGNGRGQLHVASGRLFFLEASSTSNRSVQGAFQGLTDSFATNDAEFEPWVILGLSVRLRARLTVERQLFQSGRTRVEWRDRIGRIIAERWGFGEQILEKHPFEEWARRSMGLEKATVTIAEHGLELEHATPFRKCVGLAKYDPTKNQIVTVKSISRSDAGRPKWDWLN